MAQINGNLCNLKMKLISSGQITIVSTSVIHDINEIGVLTYILSLSGLSQVGSDQIQKYFLNRGTLPTPRIVNKGRDISVRLGRPVTIPCEIMNKGNKQIIFRSA